MEEIKQEKKVRVKCRECGEEVFIMAPTCPKCGIPKPGLSASEYTKFVKRYVIIFGIGTVLVIIAIILAVKFWRNLLLLF